MLRTIEATIDKDGQVQLSEAVSLPRGSRALVTILDETFPMSEAALLAEAGLAQDWSGPAEDEAWKHLADLPAIDEAK